MFNKELQGYAEVIVGFLSEGEYPESREGQRLVKLIGLLKEYRRHPNPKLKSEINALIGPCRYWRKLGDKPPSLKMYSDPPHMHGLFVDYVLDLYEADALDRLRQCERDGCGRWLVARRRERKYCDGGRCAQRIYQKKLLKENPRYFADAMAAYRDRYPSRKKRQGIRPGIC